ncbi:MAG: Fic family protein [Candidatus Woesearchaeota archaeon]
MLLPDKTIKEIESAKNKIDRSRLDQFTKTLFERLEREAMRNASIQDKDNFNRAEEVTEQFVNGWNYAMAHYDGRISLPFIRGIAGHVEPCLFNSEPQKTSDLAPIRNHGGTSLPGMGYMPPSDRYRVEMDLERTLHVVDNQDLHPVEEALYLYFHLSRIQPFEHGNKRTANIVMNSILRGNQFAPLSIPSAEVPVYEAYLAEAIRDFQRIGTEIAEPSERYTTVGPNQQQFYNFFAKRELNALLQAHDTLKGLPTYHIKLKCKKPGAMYSAKHVISNWFRAHDTPFQEHLNTNKQELTVVGDIPRGTLTKTLDRVHGIDSYDIKYNGKK